MKSMLLQVVVILTTLTVARSLTCYHCTWNYDWPEEEPYCRDGENIPLNMTETENCALCQVHRSYHLGELKYVDRYCESERNDDLGNTKPGCYSVDYERGERTACYCTEDWCNGGREEQGGGAQGVIVANTVTLITAMMVAIIYG